MTRSPGFFREACKGNGKDTRFIRGSTRLIDAMVNGDWDEEEFLVVPPERRLSRSMITGP